MAKQTIPTLSKDVIKKTARVFKIESVPTENISIDVINIETIEVSEQNKILLNITVLGVIGNVFTILKNLPSREILFEQKEFNKIE